MRYLGIEPKLPRVAFFDFTGCEGCQLQIANKEETLIPFLNAIEVVHFREVSSAAGRDYEIAFVDGAVSRYDEVRRLQAIRAQSGMLVAMGSCACFGGVNRLKNDYDLQGANREVYGNDPKETLPVRPVKEIVPVDMEIPGCPVSKAELERILQHLIWEIPYIFPAYPVCMECKQRFTVCLFEIGQLCLGPVTRGGCDAPCPAGGLGCWGCRGPAADANFDEFFVLAKSRGFSGIEIRERLNFFGGFKAVA